VLSRPADWQQPGGQSLRPLTAVPRLPSLHNSAEELLAALITLARSFA
jgi:hypothetical protein